MKELKDWMDRVVEHKTALQVIFRESGRDDLTCENVARMNTEVHVFKTENLRMMASAVGAEISEMVSPSWVGDSFEYGGLVWFAIRD